MNVDIEIMVVRFKGKVITAFGIQEVCNTIQVCVGKDDLEAIKADKETMDALPKFIRTYASQSSTCLGETEAYHFCGKWGNLEVKMERHCIDLLECEYE